MKHIIVVAAAAAIACAVAAVIILQHSAARKPTPPTAKAVSQPEPVETGGKALPATPPEPAPAASAEATSPTLPNPAVESAAAPSASASAAPKAPNAARQAAGGGKAKEPLRDPMAREALALVGLDPAAEEYWYAAINDPSLSAHERSDLIEDLNEDGFSDPKRPAPEDLPLILSRIQVIEAAGPYAMDQVNADAFQEAYKDLVNLATRFLSGN